MVELNTAVKQNYMPKKNIFQIMSDRTWADKNFSFKKDTVDSVNEHINLFLCFCHFYAELGNSDQDTNGTIGCELVGNRIRAQVGFRFLGLAFVSFIFFPLPLFENK